LFKKIKYSICSILLTRELNTGKRTGKESRKLGYDIVNGGRPKLYFIQIYASKRQRKSAREIEKSRSWFREEQALVQTDRSGAAWCGEAFTFNE
jgi:hypothetical protein